MKLENSTGSYKANQPKRERAISRRNLEKRKKSRNAIYRVPTKKKWNVRETTGKGRRGKVREREKKRENGESPNYKSSEKARRGIHKDI